MKKQDIENTIQSQIRHLEFFNSWLSMNIEGCAKLKKVALTLAEFRANAREIASLLKIVERED